MTRIKRGQSVLKSLLVRKLIVFEVQIFGPILKYIPQVSKHLFTSSFPLRVVPLQRCIYVTRTVDVSEKLPLGRPRRGHNHTNCVYIRNYLQTR